MPGLPLGWVVGCALGSLGLILTRNAAESGTEPIVSPKGRLI